MAKQMIDNLGRERGGVDGSSMHLKALDQLWRGGGRDGRIDDDRQTGRKGGGWMASACILA